MARIPRRSAKTIADEYTKVFIDNRIQETRHLTKDVLKELGLNVIGDKVAISTTAATTEGLQAIASGGTNIKNKTHFKPKVEFPRIKGQMTTADFRKFKLDWQVYKSITGILYISWGTTTKKSTCPLIFWYKII